MLFLIEEGLHSSSTANPRMHQRVLDVADAALITESKSTLFFFCSFCSRPAAEFRTFSGGAEHSAAVYPRRPSDTDSHAWRRSGGSDWRGAGDEMEGCRWV